MKETEDAVRRVGTAGRRGRRFGSARDRVFDVRSNDTGDLVVTKGDSYDVREKDEGEDVRNLGKPVNSPGSTTQGADEGRSEHHRLGICPSRMRPCWRSLDGLQRRSSCR